MPSGEQSKKMPMSSKSEAPSTKEYPELLMSKEEILCRLSSETV